MQHGKLHGIDIMVAKEIINRLIREYNWAVRLNNDEARDPEECSLYLVLTEVERDPSITCIPIE